MKLIALREFRNVGRKIKIDNAQHDDHVHKGATFEIGAGDEIAKLASPDKELAAQLIYAGFAGDATDAKIVKRVQAEVAAEEKKAKAAATAAK